jgi:MerR family transcriptional regulator, copper efflux regulator
MGAMNSVPAAAKPRSLSIGTVAKAAGVNVQTLRYYERVGLMPAAKRSSSGYRLYTDETVRMLTFVKRAQELGFTLREVKELLKFRTAGLQKRDAVRAAAQAKVEDIDARIADLTAIRAALSSLLTTCACQGTKPECPILEALEKKTHDEA